MKAVVCTKYGPPEVFKSVEAEKPVPKDDEVLIKVIATAVTASDIYIRSGHVKWSLMIPFRLMMGLTGPRNPIIGEVLSGQIEATGKDIKKFRPGDRVYGLTGFSLGAYAEYKCMKENDSVNGCISLKPENISYEEATMAAYGGLLAFQFMEKANIQPGQEVLIYGASGTTGIIAIQLAISLGANVTAVCSTTNLELVKSLGADRVIDYTKEDTLSPGIKYDFILDAVGKSKSSKLKDACKKALTAEGKYVSIDDGSLMLDSNRLSSIKVLVESGRIKPVIDRIYPLEQIVEAHTYVGRGHKKGGVVITIG